MDPLTHTLVGASLAATRLGRTTRRATAALVIGVNLPDIDVLSYVNGGDAALGFLAARLDEGASDADELRAWTDLCHVLFNVKEFVFLR